MRRSRNYGDNSLGKQYKNMVFLLFVFGIFIMVGIINIGLIKRNNISGRILLSSYPISVSRSSIELLPKRLYATIQDIKGDQRIILERCGYLLHELGNGQRIDRRYIVIKTDDIGLVMLFKGLLGKIDFKIAHATPDQKELLHVLGNVLNSLVCTRNVLIGESAAYTVVHILQLLVSMEVIQDEFVDALVQDITTLYISEQIKQHKIPVNAIERKELFLELVGFFSEETVRVMHFYVVCYENISKGNFNVSQFRHVLHLTHDNPDPKKIEEEIQQILLAIDQLDTNQRRLIGELAGLYDDMFTKLPQIQQTSLDRLATIYAELMTPDSIAQVLLFL